MAGRKTSDFEEFKIGDKILVKADRKSFIESSIKGAEFIRRQETNKELICFLVDSDVKKNRFQLMQVFG